MKVNSNVCMYALRVRKMDIGDVDREECTEEAADVAGEDEPAFWFWGRDKVHF